MEINRESGAFWGQLKRVCKGDRPGPTALCHWSKGISRDFWMGLGLFRRLKHNWTGHFSTGARENRSVQELGGTCEAAGGVGEGFVSTHNGEYG